MTARKKKVRSRPSRHPITAVAFDWKPHLEEKLALRNITPGDVEDVFHGIWGQQPEFKRNKKAGTARWMMTGRDRGGRWLRIGILWADEDARLLKAIHGLPL